MERSDTTALSSYVLVNDTLLVNESSPTEENGALYQSSAGNTYLFRVLPETIFLLPHYLFYVFYLLVLTYNIRGDCMFLRIWRFLKRYIFVIIFIFCILTVLFSLVFR